MSVPWLKNMLGFSLTEKELKEIPYPKVELTMHIVIKAVQAFGFLGSILVATVYAFMSDDSRSWLEIMIAFGRNGMILGLVLGPVMTYLRMRGRGEPEYLDRCYRLRKNRVQVHIDQASICGVVCGAGMACMGFVSTPFGCVVGLLCGIFLGIIYNRVNAAWLHQRDC